MDLVRFWSAVLFCIWMGFSSCTFLEEKPVSGAIPVYSSNGKILRYYPYSIRWIGFGPDELPDTTRLADFRELVSLEILHPNFENLEELSSLKSVGFLNVNGTKVRNLSPLSKLPALHSLYLHGTEVDETDLSRYPGVSGLTKLGLYKTKIRDLSFIGSECKLRQLDIRGTEVSSLEPIAGCKNLWELRIGDTKIKELKYVYEMKDLRYLEWSGLQISKEDLETIRLRLPYLKLVPMYLRSF
ncbi:leucine-rich repeat domain-containing protein [Leptospira gomenensis]|uniref:Leucine-rich repeat domain-containing protein n=1 Tax=Leptospira gomenensis TaxID=2484974 RepID=A0A5F1YRG5_9LEPT|nr:leucine-rich repeat domain-containing protein [Leptospira gomenensis]TGK33864.1 leucine-rich repeat domain-containing protein [Leptospira gomenensis]TGK36319.1 leucine-rich repeat domain-containing protein [Leptospira gomenensis]TGK52089.1 leucine-rich repeat domain-containing protein [Leptospira gomenensis]TGK59862.1 leucine-rich repeat domain-containing protein [Leptospira gomenensis]